MRYIKKVKQPKSNGIRHWALTIIFAISTLPLLAEPVVVPIGLTPGDRYRLAFVTSGTRDATSTLISDYNAFVTAQANLSPGLSALGTTWRVIGSTDFVNAITNIGSPNDPAIYNTNGGLVAIDIPDLFGGFLSNPINWDQLGIGFMNRSVWTGSDPSGFRSFDPLGVFSIPTIGNSSRTDSRWINNFLAPPFISNSFYAISDELIVSDVPEPGTLTMLGAGATLLWLLKRRRSATPDNRS